MRMKSYEEKFIVLKYLCEKLIALTWVLLGNNR